MRRPGALAVLVTLVGCGGATGLEAGEGCPASIPPGTHIVSAVVLSSDCHGDQPPGQSWSGLMDFIGCEQSACSLVCHTGSERTELTWNGSTWNYQYTGPDCSVLYTATIAGTP